MKCKEKGCKQEVIYVLTSNNKYIPINAKSITQEDILMIANGYRLNYKHGIHVPHWVTCDKEKEKQK